MPKTSRLIGALTTLLVTASVLLAGCTTPDVTTPSGSLPAQESSGTPQAPQAVPDEVRIRVSNVGTVSLRKVVVIFPGRAGDSQREQYGDLAPGQSSDYRAVGLAYSYAYVEALAGGVPVKLQPIDYVGETPLEPGNYTYTLEAVSESSDGAERLDLKLRRD